MVDFLRSARQRGQVRGRAVTRRAYALQPVRPLAARVATWALVGIVCAAAGAMAMRGYAMRVLQTTSADAPCTVPAAHDELQDALARAELALKQQAASRASVQKSADALTVEVRQLQAQVLFLQGQSRSRR